LVTLPLPSRIGLGAGFENFKCEPAHSYN